jgi:hypothetical protein
VRPGVSASPALDQSSEKTPLTKEELAFFEDYFAKPENNGFLLSNYSEPSDIDLQQLFYTGAGMASDSGSIGKDEADAFVKAYKLDSIEGDFMKLTAGQVDDFLTEKMGITLSDTSGDIGWLYLPEYDAYYTQVFDTNVGFFGCVGGHKTDDGKVVVECKANSEYGQQVESCTVTLQKTGDKYLFVSNDAKMAW